MVQELLKSITHEEYEAWASPGMQLWTTLLGALIVYAVFNWAINWFDTYFWKAPIFLLSIGFLFWAITSSIGFLCFFVSYLYRISLKSTSLLWLPLIYVVRSSVNNKAPLDVKIAEMRDSALWSIVRIFSWATLTILGWKIFILPYMVDWWNEQSWATILNIFLMPNILHPWHIATGINALFSILLYYVVFEPAPRYLNAKVWSKKIVKMVIDGFMLVRGFISIYTIFVGISIAVLAAPSMKWPEFSWDLFPW